MIRRRADSNLSNGIEESSRQLGVDIDHNNENERVFFLFWTVL